MKTFKNTRGLVLAEALLAIAMLSISVVVTASIIQNALESTNLSKNYLVAQGLATEGVEAVKSIRDTNWLKEPANSYCWLRFDPSNPASSCDSAYYADNGDVFVPMINTSGSWYLSRVPGNKALLLEDESKTIPTESIIYDWGRGLSHTVSSIQSPYYRTITFESISPFASSALVEVKIQWKEGQKVRTILRSVTIFNYL
ncbi:hypothetical protein HN709_01620 [Candidatus Peregrinibacteria bacterium]|nr:hypothetical protein [Candidatus Peregrinibacteria bacterium]